MARICPIFLRPDVFRWETQVGVEENRVIATHRAGPADFQ